jgi:hypothetical protein
MDAGGVGCADTADEVMAKTRGCQYRSVFGHTLRHRLCVHASSCHRRSDRDSINFSPERTSEFGSPRRFRQCTDYLSNQT